MFQLKIEDKVICLVSGQELHLMIRLGNIADNFPVSWKKQCKHHCQCARIMMFSCSNQPLAGTDSTFFILFQPICLCRYVSLFLTRNLSSRWVPNRPPSLQRSPPCVWTWEICRHGKNGAPKQEEILGPT